MPTAWQSALGEISSDLALRLGCSSERIAEAEQRLGVRFPRELAEYLEATDGLYDNKAEYAYGWSLDEIVRENTRAWGDGTTALDSALLAFGGDGAGAWFCVSLAPDSATAVFHWNWIDLESRPVAPDLASFWHGWLTGATGV
jgi:cell wall assembly regulator SMI1